MTNKCIVCGEEIPLDHACICVNGKYYSCLHHERTRELKEVLENLEKKGDNKMLLTDSEKLELINTMEFIESDGDCDGIVYVLVDDNKENRDILYKIGLTDEDIETYCNPEEDTLDISPIAFRYANWYGGKEKGFYNKPELNIKSMAVVNRGDLVDYLMTCKEDCWTRSGWDKLFEELETNLTYASK